ncbi:MAG: beta-N-acetylglucosaminidase domain-containing protein [Candidatus Limnocylindrales bacterium]
MTPVLGVIEGFYGRPWSWADRDGMVDFMARHGFRLYVYAPKDDRHHRVRWREPYPRTELARFERLAGRCARAGIEFVYGLTPWRLAMHDYAGIDIAWQKLQDLLAVGAAGLCLSFDDLPDDVPKDPTGAMRLARWQASVGNELDERMRAKRPDGRFLFTPTEYHGRGESPYLHTLGAALAPGIQILWTGPQVCSPTISGADLVAVTRSLGRQPLIWDNYPVNDGGMRWDPHLRPLQGRSADLPSSVRGVVANPALEAESSKVALHTLAAYWSDPAGYDPEAAWQRALVEVTGSGADADALAVLARLASRSPLHQEPAPEWLTEPRPRADVEPELDALRGVVARLSGAMTNGSLQRDIRPWVAKLAAWVALAGDALAMPGAQTGKRDTARRLGLLRRRRFRVSDEAFGEFVAGRLRAAGSAVLATDPVDSKR